MNKRFMTGLAVAASTLAASQAEAVTKGDPECAPVYDQIHVDGISSELQAALAKYATKSIEVHVQILKESNSIQVHDDKEAEAYQAGLERDCEWPDISRLNIFVSDNPRVFSLDMEGKIARDTSDQKFESAQGQFVDDLGDPETSHQVDAARLLNRLYPQNKPVPISESDSPSQEFSEPSGGGGADVPWGLLGGGLGSLLLLGAAGTRAGRGVGIRKEYREGKIDADELYSQLANTIAAIDEAVQVLPEDDVPELREAQKVAAEHAERIENELRELLVVYKDQRKKVWPDKGAVDQEAADIDAAHDPAVTANETAKEQLAIYQHQLENLDELTASFNGGIGKAREAIEALEAQGWDLIGYKENLNDYVNVQREVTMLRDSAHVGTPSSLMEENSGGLEKLRVDISALPGRRIEVDAAIEGQKNELTVSEESFADISAQLATLRVVYDSSCYEDIDEFEEASRIAQNNLTRFHTSAQVKVGVKTQASVAEAEELSRQFNDTRNSISTRQQQIHKRQATLKEIEENLPAVIKALESDIDAVREFAFEEHPDDVEDETRNSIEALEQELQSFETTEVSADKPKFLEIDAKTDEYSEKISALTDRAQQEKVEMDSLRASAQALAAEARRDQQKLASYISSNSSDISGVSSNFQIPDFDASLNRASLRSSVEGYNSVISDIGDALSSARADVERAEAARRAERERREREAREAQQAREAATRSSHGGGNFGGGGRHGGGGHGGGSKHGGGTW